MSVMRSEDARLETVVLLLIIYLIDYYTSNDNLTFSVPSFFGNSSSPRRQAARAARSVHLLLRQLHGREGGVVDHLEPVLLSHTQPRHSADDNGGANDSDPSDATIFSMSDTVKTGSF